MQKSALKILQTLPPETVFPELGNVQAQDLITQL
jgi:hypothetical protein